MKELPISLVKDAEPDESVILRLEDLLEMAKSGELIGFVLAGVSFTNRKECSVYCKAGKTSAHGMVYALEQAKMRIMGVEFFDEE